MRIKTFTNGGYASGGFVIAGGGTLTGPLFLFGTPTQDLVAVPKKYVDDATASFNASEFTTGTIPTTRLPAFSGSVTSTAGSNVLSLPQNGVSEGVYTKYNVNAEGLVTYGTSLTEDDLPALDWSIFTSGKPTTLTGYNISDALPLSGGVISTNLVLHADPINDLHAVTKQYVDSKFGTSIGLNPGDIVVKSVSSTPNGFLRCNGSTVSKTTYADLFSVVGDTFTPLTQIGKGQPWRQQVGFNTTQAGDITGWAAGTAMPVGVNYAQVLVTKNRVYVIGGISASSASAEVYTAPINGDGTIGAWATTTALPQTVSKSHLVVTKNRVYLIGGVVNGGSSNVIYTAPINSDGTLGAWATTATNFPVAIKQAHVVSTGSRVYVIGGNVGGNAVTTSYYAPINSDGTLGAWALSSSSTPSPIYSGQVIVTKNYVYIIGGRGGIGYPNSVAYRGVLNADGTITDWTNQTAASGIPGTRSDSSSIIVGNQAYLIAGFTGSSNTVTNTVYTSTVNADGTLSSWTTLTSLPVNLAVTQIFTTTSKVYLLTGVTDGGTISADVYSAGFSGGLNDYSTYYDGVNRSASSTDFGVPDLSATDLPNTYSYIKY